jgi:alkaline phosphatase D
MTSTRRELLRAGGLGAAAIMLGTGELNSGRAFAQASFAVDPYTLGVASGDPQPDGVVLWTRLAPDPLHGGGLPPQAYRVRWEVARDERFRRVVRRGTAQARPELAHSVHPEVRGLEPDREYFYRFDVNGALSPVGRTRTAAERGGRQLRFGFASCQNYQDGFYTSHHHLANEELAFVVFLGDYIYEGAPNPNALRTHEGTGEPLTLENYRNRHAQYRSDPNLRAAHGSCPWIVTFDDHEIDNNWADDIPQDPAQQTPEAFRARRIAAFQAYYEHMPLRRSALPSGPDIRVYRRITFGDLAELNVLDTRQYRTDQRADEAAANDPANSMTGPQQERWLTSGLARSRARWNLIGQQTMIAQNDRRAGPERVFDFDNWDGYRVQRKRLLEFAGRRAHNPIVLTGDRHCTWACDLKPDFDDPLSPVVGAELTGTSISSGGDANAESFHAQFDPIMAESPHWKYIDNRRGYFVVDLTRNRLRADLRTVSTVRAETAAVTTAATFEVRDGRPGVEVISG